LTDVRSWRASHDASIPATAGPDLITGAVIVPTAKHWKASAMNPDISTLYTLFNVEHDLRVAQVQRDRRAEEAAASHSRPVLWSTVCQRIGGVLILAGERLGGTPRRTTTAGVADSPMSLQRSS
jgi:hypothetical protein